MGKFVSAIPERFRKMANSSDPSAADIEAAKKQLKIEVPAYIASLSGVDDNKKKEIGNRYVMNTVRHMIDKEKTDAEHDTPINRLKDKIKEKNTAKKIMVRTVVESAVAGEISFEEEYILLESIR